MTAMPLVSISVVSHGQIDMIDSLLRDLEQHCDAATLEVILTLNLPEDIPFDIQGFAFPLQVIRNPIPLGFSANHNQAFRLATGTFYCVLNPDIRLPHDPFRPLRECLGNAQVGVAAPLVLDQNGKMEDSARHFPTPLKILCKAIGRCRGSDYQVADTVIYPEWVGGMFMLFRHEVYEKLGGFDQRYFLYYEDVDLCARLRLDGYQVALCPAARVVHHAHRSSHRNLKYFRRHLASMLRFFLSAPFLRICWLRWSGRF